jgi:carboxypeptidase Taq
MNTDYTNYHNKLRTIADIQYSMALLSWDQEVYMPSKSADFRAGQLSTLAGIAHEMAVDNDLGNLLEKLSADTSLTEKESRNIKESHRSYKDQKKYSTAFVVELNKTISEAYQAWHKARTQNNFSLFAPVLEKLVKLKQKECEILGYNEHPYDALLDQYEPGAKVSELDVLFTNVKEKLVPFVKRIAEAKQNDADFLYLDYNKNTQWDFGIFLLEQMQYDFEAGRQDISAHPFTTSFSPLDVRVTTRINEKDLREMIWGCIHEGGHALYEQGLNPDDYGLPSAEAISLGIHESQSRLWENNVGRSLAYWKANYERLQNAFPQQLKNISLDSFYNAINLVEPSLIRTSADELTYHFHIMIRYEIEKELISGNLSVYDLPQVWNRKYKEYMNLDVPSDDQGVLQDIHWSHGSFGYFPTYSLGSFYAAQFFAKAKEEVNGLEEHIEKGELKPLLLWLREKIHKHGKYYKASELCEEICGKKIDFNYFYMYVENKYKQIYGLS